MLKIYLNLLFLISTILFVPYVSANAIVTGDLTYDDVTGIITSSTGQSYLSWDKTHTLSYTEIIAATTSGDLTDYHVATQSEAYEFYHFSGGTAIDESGAQVISHDVPGVSPSIFGKDLPGFVLSFFMSNEEQDIGFISPGSGKITLNDNYAPIDQANSLSPSLRTWVLAANSNVAVVPVPASVWLMGTGILGLISMRHKKKTLAVLAS